MSEIKVNNIQSLSGTNGPEISGTVEMNSTGAMSLPRGDTAYRGGRGRGVYGGGGNPAGTTRLKTIEYVTIPTLGNGSDFGDLTVDRNGLSAVASVTRGVFCAGEGPAASPAKVNRIDYITIPSTGNAFDFGDMASSTDSFNKTSQGSCSDGVRGLFAGAYNPYTSVISKITIAQTGNATDFGNLSSKRGILSGCASPTRGVFGGGYEPSPIASVNTIEYVTIATMGDALNFGDLTTKRSSGGALSNAIRGVWGGAYSPLIDYITIASLGDSIDFGDISVNRGHAQGTASPTRGIFMGGRNHPSPTASLNTIDYITIMTIGNATDFGDLTEIKHAGSACSDAHGGLG